MKLSLYFKILSLTLMAMIVSGGGIWLLAKGNHAVMGWLLILAGVLLLPLLPALFLKPVEKMLSLVETFLVTEQLVKLPPHPADPFLGRISHLLNSLLARARHYLEQVEKVEQVFQDFRASQERERGQERELRQQRDHHLTTLEQEAQLCRSGLQQALQDMHNAQEEWDHRWLLREQEFIRQQEGAVLELQSKQDEIDTLRMHISELNHALQQAKNGETAHHLELAAAQKTLVARQEEMLVLQQEKSAMDLMLQQTRQELSLKEEELQQEKSALDRILQQTRQELSFKEEELQQAHLQHRQLSDNLEHLQEDLVLSNNQLEVISSQFQRLSNALDQHAIVSIADVDGIIIQVNDLFCQTSGYQRDELIGKNHNIINSGYHDKNYFREMWQCLLAGQVWHGEIRNQAKDGHPYWVKGTIIPFPDQEGNPCQFMAIRTDITGQKNAEEQARGMALFAQFNPSPQLRVDGLGCLIKSNPAAHTLLNLPDEDQVVLSNYLTAVEGIDWPSYVQNGESMQFTTQLGERYFQFTLLGVPELTEAHLYGTETTQTVEAEKKLQIQHHFLLQIANHMGEGVYAIDQQGRLTFINQEAQRMLGYQEKELLGKPIHDVIHYQNAHGEPIAHDSCPVLQTMLTGQIYRVVEDVFTHRDGRLIPVAFTSSPLLEGNQVMGSVNVFQDITQRKQMDQEIRQARDLALEASRLKSEFLANMSHEIRTPMNGIIGMTDLLLDTKLNKDQRELATTARESAHALLTIINDILDFSKIEAGKLELESAEFSPIRVVEGVAELVAPQAHNKSLDIICDVSQQVPPILKGDAGRIRQVLLNLAGNAVKFTKKGEIVLSVTVETRTETHVILRFAVSDTGIGVPKSAHHRLFQPFTQVDGSSSREYGGTGLGLSISSRLVEMMGGEIGLVSKKSKGSTFWFTVPLLLASTTEATKDSTILPQLKGLKVLLTVSNQTSQTILMNHLINWNMRCTAVESQEEAMAILRHDAHRIHPFQLAIVDDYPIAQEAMELVARIRQEPSLAETRVLLFTASKEEGYLSQAQEAGVNGYLYKPLRQGNLLECIVTLFHEGGDHNESPTADQPILLTPDTASKTILLAEDNPVNQKVAQMQIRRLGLAVHTVANGKEAVEQAATGNYSLILMDCQMPLLNGFEACQAIRRQEGTTRHIPIIALTANAMKGDRERCLEAGMDDYLSKPVEYPKLASKLRQWLNLAAPTTQTAAPVIEPPFDLSNLRSLFAGNMNAVVEALKSFLASSALLQQEMNDQINRQDRSGIRHTILAIQEASQQLEADNLDELCRQLDIVCSVGDWKRARVILDKLQAQLNRLETYVHTLPSG